MTTQELVGYWRQCSTYADSDDERDTWIRCAEMLEETLRVAAQASPPTPPVDREWLVRIIIKHRAAWNSEYEDDFGHSKLDDFLNELEDLARLGGMTVEASSFSDTGETK